MGPVTAVKTCFCKFATFSGRAGRAEYWYWVLFTWVVYLVVPVVVVKAVGGTSWENVGGLAGIFLLSLTIPSVAVGCRRLHDVGRSGWWQLLMPTFVGVPLLIWWWAGKSRKGTKYSD